MTLLLITLAVPTAILVTLVTCLQVLYLESLRIRARELPALQFFKETLEQKLGLEMERGSLAFSLVKHIGLAIVGCLSTAIALEAQNGLTQSVVIACVGSGVYTVFGTYIVPQLFYRRTSGHLLVPFIPLFRAVLLAVMPLLWALEFLQSLFELGDTRIEEAPTRPEEHIEALISAGEEEGIIEKGDRELIQSVVAFGDKTVREVMTPRPRIVAIPEQASLEELRHLVINEQFSRIPAFDDSIDMITGFVHVRDMFELNDEQRAARKVHDIMRPIRSVPESKPVNDLMREMQEEGAHMVVVIDEYGATAGIVTMEDMVEEIVGEIHDEHEPDRDFRHDPDGSYVVSGSFDLGRLRELLDYHPQDDTEIDATVGRADPPNGWSSRSSPSAKKPEREGIKDQACWQRTHHARGSSACCESGRE